MCCGNGLVNYYTIILLELSDIAIYCAALIRLKHFLTDEKRPNVLRFHRDTSVSKQCLSGKVIIIETQYKYKQKTCFSFIISTPEANDEKCRDKSVFIFRVNR